MKIDTNTLAGFCLDWAVARAEKLNPEIYGPDILVRNHWSPSSNWSQGGPIIERERINVYFNDVLEGGDWIANDGFNFLCRDQDGQSCTIANWTENDAMFFGDTPLQAAMRCYVTRKFGKEVEVPNELIDRRTE